MHSHALGLNKSFNKCIIQWLSSIPGKAPFIIGKKDQLFVLSCAKLYTLHLYKRDMYD